MKLKQLLVLSLGLLVWESQAQYTKTSFADTIKQKTIKGLKLNYNAGNVLPTNAFMRGENESGEPIDYFQALSFKFNFQTVGNEDWEHYYHLPYYGFGYYNADFFRSEDLGYPTALYFYFGAPFHRWKRFSLGFEWGFGLTWNWKPYEKDLNPMNIAIGSHKTVYINAGFYADYRLSKRFKLGLSYAYTHFSNGATRTPNMGINLLAPAVEVSYNFASAPYEADLRKLEKLTKEDRENELAFFIAIGSKQIVVDTNTSAVGDKYWDHNFAIFDASVMYQRQFFRWLKTGFGADLSYDGSINAQYEVESIDDEYNQSDNFAIGIYWGFEWTIHRISVLGNVGAYLLRENVPSPKQKPIGYQRFGIKYHFKNNMFAGINVRAYDYGIADFIEWNLGYRIRYPKK